VTTPILYSSLETVGSRVVEGELIPFLKRNLCLGIANSETRYEVSDYNHDFLRLRTDIDAPIPTDCDNRRQWIYPQCGIDW
jgi:hypothetical protein